MNKQNEVLNDLFQEKIYEIKLKTPLKTKVMVEGLNNKKDGMVLGCTDSFVIVKAKIGEPPTYIIETYTPHELQKKIFPQDPDLEIFLKNWKGAYFKSIKDKADDDLSMSKIKGVGLWVNSHTNLYIPTMKKYGRLHYE